MSRGLRRYGADRLTGQVLDFEGLTPEMRQDLAVRLRMLGGVRRRMTWIQFILALGFHIEDEMAEAGFGAYWAGSDRLIPTRGILGIIGSRSLLIETSWAAPLLMLLFETLIDRGTTNVPHLLVQYLFRHAEGRKSGARLSGGHFIGRLAMHIRLGPERLQAIAVGASEADEAGQADKEVALEIPAPTPSQACEELSRASPPSSLGSPPG
ncbi:hypothetical protein Tco_0678654 [Tanacetum coccineum]|uniref:Uncharacterized protein n=1 Tax=Tanacetum coccineum TaxID=301880 RepID=A0ABQ4XGV7_9ASTR